MTERSESKSLVGLDQEKSTAIAGASASNQIALALAYLWSALHPLSCRANRFVVSGGVTDGSMCDCGLTAARSLVGGLNGNV